MKEIIEYLKQPIDTLNVEAMAQDLSMSVSYYFTAATYYAEKEMEYTKAVGKASEAFEDTDLNMKEKESKIKFITSEVKFKQTRADGIVKALEVRIEALRTLISKAKTEMTISK